MGLFKWGADDLRFLHHSFAEHLAATAEARLLPKELAADAPEFARLLHAARPKEVGQHARDVLLHFTRLHVPQADCLITWLHAADSEQHLLAARLLASHVPASAKVVDKFLVVVRAWAMTTQYLSGDILEQASRAVHHPGLASWLTGLMTDAKAPWASRVEAATALATRLHGPDAPAAITLLRTVVEDTEIQVSSRLSAAEALSECGAEEREHSARGLRSVLADPNASGWDCRSAAVVLAGLSDADRDHAVEVLQTMLDDPWLPDNTLADIASGLAEIGVEFHDRCADVFVTILSHTMILPGRLRDAAVGLAALGPERLADAVAILTSIANDRRRPRSLRLGASAALAELGPQHRVAAGDLAARIACEFDMEFYHSWSVANQLIAIGLHDHAETLLTAALDDHRLNPNQRLWTARELARLGPEHRDRAVRELRRVANDPRSSNYDRPAALAELAAAGEPDRSDGIAALRRVLTDRSADPMSRCRAATEMVQLGPDFHDEVIEHTLEVAVSRAEPRIQATTWHLLRDLDVDISRRALRELSETLTPESAELWASHRDDWESNHYSSIDPPDRVIPGLVATMHRPTESGNLRRNSINALISLGRRFHRLAHDGLLTLLRSHAIEPPRV